MKYNVVDVNPKKSNFEEGSPKYISVSTQSDPQFNCSHCEDSFMVKNQSATHTKINHFPEIVFKCEECDSVF